MEGLRPEDPEWIGGYRLLARLGAGGMGQVFLGRSAGGTAVAIKVVHADLTRQESFRARFRREVLAAQAVSGAFTAPVIDADPDAPRPWLVTAFLPGVTLQDAVTAHGPWPPSAVFALGAGLAEALISIHRAGLVHRDLKPSNIMLGPDGPRVIDFGIAHAAEENVLTRPGQVLGSPGYMPPEQATGGLTGPSGDVFSFGAVLAFAGTGNGPFGEASPHALVYRVVHEPPRLDTISDPQLRNLIAVCLDKHPGRRPMPAWLLDRLAALLPQDTVLNGTSWLPPEVISHIARRQQTAPPPRTLPYPAAAGLSRRRLVVLGALGAGALATGGGIAATLATSTPAGRRTTTSPRPSATRSAVSARPATGTAKLRWKRYTGSAYAADPTVAGGMVYVGSEKGQLFALDAGSGRVRWRMRTGARILGAPVLAGGLVYATSLDRSLYAVDARSGALKWRFRPGPTLGEAVVSHGLVCVGGDEEGFYGLDASTGSLRWRYRARQQPIPRPAALGRLCYLPTAKGVSAVDLGSGRVRWKFAVPQVVDPLVRGAEGPGDLCVAAGAVYFGVGLGHKALFAIDAATGRRRWTYPLGADPLRPLAVGGSVFAADADGNLYALDAASGALRWQFQSSSTTGGSPVMAGSAAMAGSNVVVASGEFGDGHVFAVDTHTGLAAWSYLIHGGIESSPAAVGDNVYVSGKDGYLYALAGATGSAVASPSRP